MEVIAGHCYSNCVERTLTDLHARLQENMKLGLRN